MHGDGHGKNRMEANTNKEVVWTLAEEHEDIQDDVSFVDGAWNKNAAVLEQKYPLDCVLALDADDAAPNDEVVKEAEAETAIVEGETVDLPEVYDDRKDEATLRDVVTEEKLVPAVGTPQTGWHVDRFPQGPGRMRLVSTPLWSLRPPTCEPELWLIIGKAAQSDEGERYADVGISNANLTQGHTYLKTTTVIPAKRMKYAAELQDLGCLTGLGHLPLQDNGEPVGCPAILGGMALCGWTEISVRMLSHKHGVTGNVQAAVGVSPGCLLGAAAGLCGFNDTWRHDVRGSLFQNVDVCNWSAFDPKYCFGKNASGQIAHTHGLRVAAPTAICWVEIFYICDCRNLCLMQTYGLY